jgi:hypothetical protein
VVTLRDYPLPLKLDPYLRTGAPRIKAMVELLKISDVVQFANLLDLLMLLLFILSRRVEHFRVEEQLLDLVPGL